MPKARRSFNFEINRLKIRIPWMIEVEGEGIIPVLGALVLCAIVVWALVRALAL